MQMPDDLDVKHCYRHPDRETGVRAPTAAGRSATSAWSRPRSASAAPSAWPSSGAAARAPRSSPASRHARAGEQRRDGGSAGFSVTKVLDGHQRGRVPGRHAPGALGTLDDQWLGGLVPSTSLDHEYWRMFTSCSCTGILHIVFNMWALWVVGGYTEAVLGRTKFLLLYFIAGFAGSVLGDHGGAARRHGRRVRRHLRRVRRALPTRSSTVIATHGAGHVRQGRVPARHQPRLQVHRRGDLLAGAHRRLGRRGGDHGRYTMFGRKNPVRPFTGGRASRWPSSSCSSRSPRGACRPSRVAALTLVVSGRRRRRSVERVVADRASPVLVPAARARGPARRPSGRPARPRASTPPSSPERRPLLLRRHHPAVAPSTCRPTASLRSSCVRRSRARAWSRRSPIVELPRQALGGSSPGASAARRTVVGLELDVLPVASSAATRALPGGASTTSAGARAAARRQVALGGRAHRRRGGVADEVFARIPGLLREGLTEAAFAGQVEAEARRSGPPGRHPHARPSTARCSTASCSPARAAPCPRTSTRRWPAPASARPWPRRELQARSAAASPSSSTSCPCATATSPTSPDLLPRRPPERSRGRTRRAEGAGGGRRCARPGVACSDVYDAALAAAADDGLAAHFMGYGPSGALRRPRRRPRARRAAGALAQRSGSSRRAWCSRSSPSSSFRAWGRSASRTPGRSPRGGVERLTRAPEESSSSSPAGRRRGRFPTARLPKRERRWNSCSDTVWSTVSTPGVPVTCGVVLTATASSSSTR